MEGKYSQYILKGMTRDLSRSKFSPEYAYELRNLRITSRGHESLFSLTNERGQKKILFNQAIPKLHNIRIYGRISEQGGLSDIKAIRIYGNISENFVSNNVVFEGVVKDNITQSIIVGANITVTTNTGVVIFSGQSDVDGIYRFDYVKTQESWGDISSLTITGSRDGYQESSITYIPPSFSQDLPDTITIDDLYLEPISLVRGVRIYGNIQEEALDGSDIFISGLVTESDGNTPIQNAEVVLLGAIKNVDTKTLTYIATVNTDANGFYSHTWNVSREDYSIVCVFVNKSGYGGRYVQNVRSYDLAVSAGVPVQTISLNTTQSDILYVSPTKMNIPASGGTYTINVTYRGTDTDGWLGGALLSSSQLTWGTKTTNSIPFTLVPNTTGKTIYGAAFIMLFNDSRVASPVLITQSA
jgi:hypothetical protein